MRVESACAGIGQIICMMNTSTYRTLLAGVGRVYILNDNACKFRLVFNVLGKSIERLGVQAVVVFTTCSCRGADVRKLLQFDRKNVVCNCRGYNVMAYLVINVLHNVPYISIAKARDFTAILGKSNMAYVSQLYNPIGFQMTCTSASPVQYISQLCGPIGFQIIPCYL